MGFIDKSNNLVFLSGLKEIYLSIISTSLKIFPKKFDNMLKKKISIFIKVPTIAVKSGIFIKDLLYFDISFIR